MASFTLPTIHPLRPFDFDWLVVPCLALAARYGCGTSVYLVGSCATALIATADRDVTLGEGAAYDLSSLAIGKWYGRCCMPRDVDIACVLPRETFIQRFGLEQSTIPIPNHAENNGKVEATPVDHSALRAYQHRYRRYCNEVAHATEDLRVATGGYPIDLQLQTFSEHVELNANRKLPKIWIA